LNDRGVSVEGELSATLIAGGRSNLTFRLEDDRTRWVLRMPPRAGRTPSAHDVAREYRVTKALQSTEVPVARPVVLCEDESVVGCPFMITEFVSAPAIQTRDQLDLLDDGLVARIMTGLTTVLATLHHVDYVAVGLERFGRPDGYAERQAARWLQQWDLVAPNEQRKLGLDTGARLLAALPDSQPSTGIVHGDYRIDNTLIDLSSPGGARVAAVVDWELSTIGDPVADVAMMCAYRDSAFDLIVGGSAAWTSTRLPDTAEMAQAYESAGGVRLISWDFHLALAYFKIGVIAAGIDHRRRAGAAAGAGFDSAGASVGRYLELARSALR
jgi:aminoglycoside phosphotransferase (APT) family kinase protein